MLLSSNPIRARLEPGRAQVLPPTEYQPLIKLSRSRDRASWLCWSGDPNRIMRQAPFAQMGAMVPCCASGDCFGATRSAGRGGGKGAGRGAAAHLRPLPKAAKLTNKHRSKNLAPDCGQCTLPPSGLRLCLGLCLCPGLCRRDNIFGLSIDCGGCRRFR